MSHAEARPSLGLPIGASVLVHAALITGLVMLRPARGPVLPPVYNVQIIAAPEGPRQEGVVRDQTPPQPEEQPRPTPTLRDNNTAPSTVAPAKPKPVTKAPAKPKQVTPSAATKKKTANSKTPTAGGGPEGGQGADVANVSIQGIEFPFPGYLQNIVRQVAERWNPPAHSALSATVVFLIHRDGSVSDFRFQTRSGSFAFDLEAQGAVDAVGSSKAFGPLPTGYPDDVLPVIFTFDPRIIH